MVGQDSPDGDFMTFDEFFGGPGTQTMKKIGLLKRQKSKTGKNELLRVLQNQRVHMDESAIHFVAAPRAGRRADARNSVFKLAQRFRALPDSENVACIHKMFNGVLEDEESGDEDWEPSFRKMPEVLKSKRATPILEDASPEHLMDEANSMGDDAQAAPQGVLTYDQINEDQTVDKFVNDATGHPAAASRAAEERRDDDKEDSDDDDDDDDEIHFAEEEMDALNSMQREFINRNLFAWFTDVRHAYETGVKLVKVNALGHKFIRIVEVKDFLLSIKQPHTLSTVKIDRQVAVTSIVAVRLGKESRQFSAMKSLIEQGLSAAVSSPAPTQCAVVELPGNRTLSLIFLDEENRNGFVFFLRVMIKKALAAASTLQES
ncbi:hypothetical protein BESB_073000 [Besnoitia besnoiti]|uniref:Uncharacterized protein n=1 Tax=Besnoitia besnoiti TaxID=94643 RepID=A0A2A9M6P6_BESBE|nr:uncharacterized protein BESB_073000 [Besnoitia besnoiti]PFH34148.1 hypothetical protein BESB_073000 [Besnoitia besnoiti]